MAIYAIGDVQGCYSELNRLLEKIAFDPADDQLWFCGDLVNRGSESLKTLQFVKSLGDRAISVLGNHDLHLLALHHGVYKVRDTSSLQQVLDSPDRDELMDWLQRLPILHFDETHNALLVHAGVHPDWGLSKALKLASEVETALRGKHAKKFLSKMYGNKPTVWSDDLSGGMRLRVITNIFTRMRYFNAAGELDFDSAGSPRKTMGSGLTPWFQMDSVLLEDKRIFFGHWSTLPVGCYGRCFALDGGCVWGGHMVALRIDYEAEDWFFVDSHTRRPANTAS
ncbi:symmetrical bis(5'-nucleosyl)-tetraphosphatase [Gammaproteobacteria bacterium]|nr:symmetrical bis(5'-nucleosyl)-tetraphosphatase [Gammaproteobacteria bacterium]